MTAIQYVDSRAFPHCLVANKPRRSRREATVRIPEQPAAAEGIVELREWAQKNWRWLNLSRWSRGLPALAAPMRPRRAPKPVSEMTWQEIDATASTELPSISAELFDELGVEAWALDGLSTDDPEEGTIAERIGGDAFANIAVRTVRPLAELTTEERAAYDAWVSARLNTHDRRYARSFGVAYDYPSAQVTDRIEWEQYVAQCSGITANEGFRIIMDERPKDAPAETWANYTPHAVDVQYFCWPKTRGEAFSARKRAKIADFLARIGRDTMPTPDEFVQRRNMLRTLLRQPRWADAAKALDDQFAELDRDRQSLIASDGATSYDAVEADYVPAYATLVEAAWQARKPEGWIGRDAYSRLRKESREVAFARWLEMTEAAERVLVHHCRNTRTHGSQDEMWHTTPRDPNDAVIGWLDGEFAYTKREMREHKPVERKPLEPAKAVTVRDLMRIEACASRALARYTVPQVLRLGRAEYVFAPIVRSKAA